MAGARGDILAGRAYVELFVKNSRFIRGLNQARQRLAQFGADMTAMGRQMVVMSAAMLLPIAMGAKTFANFDDSMRAVKAVTNATESEFAALTETAKRLGRTTSFTAIEIGSLMTELGRAGFAANQVDVMTESVLSLARATSTEAPLAAGIMAASIRQFGLEAKDAGRVADGLTAAANKSFNTVEQLGESLKFAGPVARDFNMSFEDTLAVLGGLGNMGIQASNAGTAIRRLLTKSGAEAENMERIFGIAFRDAAGNTRPLVDILAEVTEATKDLGTAERAKLFNEAFGIRGITGASAIGRSADDIRDLQKAIKEAGGTAEETAKAMDAGLGGAFRIMRSAIEGAMIALGEAVEGELASVVESGTQVLGIVTKLVEENKAAVVTFAKWGVAIAAAGAALMAIGLSAQFASVVIGGFLSIVSGVTFVIGSLVGAIAFLFSPLGMLVAGLVAAGVAFFKFSDAGKSALASLRSRAASILGSLKETFGSTFSGIMDAIKSGDLGLAGKIAMTGLRLAFEQGMQSITSFFKDAWKSIVSGKAFAGAWDQVVSALANRWNQFTQGIVSSMAEAARGFVLLWNGAIQSIVDKAAKGGTFGKVFKMFTGVDAVAAADLDKQAAAVDAKTRDMLESAIPEAEQSLKIAIDAGDQKEIDSLNDRLEFLKAALKDIEESDPLSNIDSIADSLTVPNSAIDALADMQAGADELRGKSPGASSAVVPGDSARSGRITKLQEELAELRKQAKKSFAESQKEGQSSFGVLKSDGAPGAFGAGGAGGASGSGSGKASVATFSGAAALLMGQGTGAEKKMDEVKKAVEKVEKVSFDQLGFLDRLNTNIKNFSLHHP